MAAKIMALVITVLINIALGAVILFFMLIAMNGFSGSDAEKGLMVYIALALAVTALMGMCAFLATRFLIKREFSRWVAALIAMPIFSVVGGGLKIVCGVIGIAVAEYVRVNH